MKREISKEEAEFLKSYNIKDFDRPSVTADIVAFAMRNIEDESWRKDNKESHLAILLIKRGQYPYKNEWALPGGFVRMDETLEECAIRELKEETNVSPASIMLTGVYSGIDRDPRGRIISNAYTTIISEDDAKIIGGDDALEAKWFYINLDKVSDDEYVLGLENGDIHLKSTLRRSKKMYGSYAYEIMDAGNIAFDHAIIITSALMQLREKVERFDKLFDFLPENFTLAQLQNVQETVLNVSLLTANFRRKIAPYVEELDEFTSGAGHRPAQLFRRK